jgi:hypothetical protein
LMIGATLRLYDVRAKGAGGLVLLLDRVYQPPKISPHRRILTMRYLVALQMLGRAWAEIMLARGVSEETVESWLAYYNRLTISAATAGVEEIREVGQRMGTAFRIGLYYVERAERES